MGSTTFRYLPAEVHGLILSYAPDVATLHALVQASRQSHYVYRILQRAILESVVRRQTPHLILSVLLCVRAFDPARAEFVDVKLLSDELRKFGGMAETPSKYSLSIEESKWLVSRNKLVEEFISEFVVSKIHQLENFCRKKDSKSLGEASHIAIDQPRYRLSDVEHYRLRRAFVSLDLVGCLFGASGLAEAMDDTEDIEDTEDTEVILADLAVMHLFEFWASLQGELNQAQEFRCVTQHLWQTLDMYRSESPNYTAQSQPIPYGSPCGKWTIFDIKNALGSCLPQGLPGIKSALTSLFNGTSVKHSRTSKQELIRIRAVLQGHTSAVPVRVMKPLTSWHGNPNSDRYEVETLGTERDDESILAIDRVCSRDDIDCSNATSLWLRKVPRLMNGPSISNDMQSYGYAIWSDERFHRLVTKKR